ncbi:hypothetical protein QBC44DRAFT_326248 [Cladorrhinum sp. PSN332]|nr:hypothetical protein QBC44DRAFT_326248 [Cladorrhinum sp. PSN332]
MSTPRIVIDGLWRCLCPSIDAAFLAKAIEKPLPLSTPRGVLATTRRQRNNNNNNINNGSTTTTRHQQQIRGRANGSNHTPNQIAKFYKIDRNAKHSAWSAERIVQNHTIDYGALDATPVANIYKAIRTLQDIQDSATKIRMLVYYAVKRGERPNSDLYEAMVAAACDPRKGFGDELHNIWIEMAALEVAPSASFYHTMLKALAIHPDYLTRGVVLKRMELEGVELSLEGRSYVALGLLRENQIEMALDYLEEMRQGGFTVSYWVAETFVFVLGRRGFLDEAFQLLLSQLGSMDTGIDRISLNLWHFVLEECSKEMHYAGTKTAWDEIVEPGILNPSDGLTSNVLNTAARYGDSTLAMQAIQKLSAKKVKLNAVHYEALLEAYAQQGDLAQAFEVLCIMAESGIQAELASTRPIFKLLMRSPELGGSCMEILTDLQKRQHQIPSSALNVVLEFAAVRGGMEVAMDVYDEIRPFTVAGRDGQYLGFLLTQAKSSADGEFLASQMERFAVEHTKHTLDEMVRLSAIDGDVEDAFRYLWKISRLIRSPQSSSSPSNKTLVILMERLFREMDPRVWTVLAEIDRRRPSIIRGLTEKEEKLLEKIPEPEYMLPLLVVGSPDPHERQKALDKAIAAREAEAARKAEEAKAWHVLEEAEAEIPEGMMGRAALF